MATQKHIVTTSPDAKVSLSSLSDGRVLIKLKGTENEATDTANEQDLIDAVLEYAHERGLRRLRRVGAKTKQRQVRRTKQMANGAEAASQTEAALS